MLKLVWKKKEDNISSETFKREVFDIKFRLDMLEEDVKRLRKRAKLPEEIKKGSESIDEDIIKALEDDGFKEIRAISKRLMG